MNFQAVLQASGNNVTMLGTFDEIGGITLTQNQKQVCKCKIIDDNREKHTVNIYGTMPLPTLLNMRAQFSLSSFKGQTQQGQPYTGYSGFWQDRVNVNQQQQAPPQAPQGVQQAAQGTNYQSPAPQGIKMPDSYAYPVTPKTQERMAASVACQCAAQIYGVAPEAMPADEAAKLMLQIAQPIKDWILNRQTKANPAVQNNPDHVTESDQFCVHCGNPHAQCSCTPNF